jgi:hypothetical protein
MISLLMSVLLAAVCYRVAQANGYLSPRHLVLPASVAAFAAVAGLAIAGRWLWRHGPIAAVLVLTAISLPRLLAPLHADRSAFRAAGEWIARNAQPGDGIWDPYAHAYYHAGRVFTEGRQGVPASDPVVSYVVLERSNNTHEHLYYLVEEAEKLAKMGEKVEQFPLGRKRHDGTVEVYRVRAPLKHPAL